MAEEEASVAAKWHHQSSSSTKFQDSSIDCAICLEPLENSDCITLSCGHKWHLHCLKEQLEQAQPNHTHRLLFSGCRCAKCGQFCNHEQLQHLTRKVDILREKVDRLVAEQWQIEAPELWNDATTTTAIQKRERLLEQGRQKFAFYLCKSCEDPYFGGTIECADNINSDEEDVQSSGLCPSCTPQSQLSCRHPLQHRAYHVWKCRYCCFPAQYVCYGTVHFCKACHDRNSQRVQQQQVTTKPPPLKGIPCCPNDCTFPKPKDQHNHLNGPAASCEQVYYCAVCESSPVGVPQEAPGSRNFLQNPSGQLGLRGWKHQRNSPMSWKVETSDIPATEHCTTNFVSSFQWCSMNQKVSLTNLVRDPSLAKIEVSAKFMGRTDCPSIFMMEAIVLNRQQQPIHRAHIGPVEAPVDYWETARLIVGPLPGAQDIVMVISGKDARFWQGNYGSKAADCSIRVLGSQEELDATLLLPLADPPLPPDAGGRINYNVLRDRWLDIAAPLILLLFAWLLS